MIQNINDGSSNDGISNIEQYMLCRIIAAAKAHSIIVQIFLNSDLKLTKFPISFYETVFFPPDDVNATRAICKLLNKYKSKCFFRICFFNIHSENIIDNLNIRLL